MKPLDDNYLSEVIFTELRITLATSEISHEDLQNNPKLKRMLAWKAMNSMVFNQTVRNFEEINIDERVKNPTRRYDKDAGTFYVVDGGQNEPSTK